MVGVLAPCMLCSLGLLPELSSWPHLAKLTGPWGLQRGLGEAWEREARVLAGGSRA